MPELAPPERYLQIALRVFSRPARVEAARNDKLRHALEQAHLPYLPEVYLALTWTTTLLVLVVGYAVAIPGVLAWATLGTPNLAVGVVILLLPAIAGAGAYVGLSAYPDYRAGDRRRLIDAELPYAVNYIAAMASAGVVPSILLRDLAREATYGEVSREVAWMVRDLELLGMDLLTAINRAIARSPSLRFQEFLQGAKTTILSGGDLKAYFASKAEQYMTENRRSQREFLDGLGILAESYVTVVIAGPLFMLVLMSIMLLVGRSGSTTTAFLFVLIFIALPLAHGAFAWVLKNTAPES